MTEQPPQVSVGIDGTTVTPPMPVLDPTLLLTDLRSILGPQLAAQILDQVETGVTSALAEHKASVVAEAAATVAAELEANRQQIAANLDAHKAELGAQVQATLHAAHIGVRTRAYLVAAVIVAVMAGVLAMLLAALLGNHFAAGNLGAALAVASTAVAWLAKTGLT